MDWELISQQNQTKTNKDNINENNERVYHDYRVVDKVMLDNRSAKDETPYKGKFAIKQCYTNGIVTLQDVAAKIGKIYTVFSHIHMIKVLKVLYFEN